MSAIIKLETDEHEGFLVSIGTQECEEAPIAWNMCNERYDDVEGVLDEVRYQAEEEVRYQAEENA